MRGLRCADLIAKDWEQRVLMKGSVPSGLWDVADMGGGLVSEGLQGEAGESSARLRRALGQGESQRHYWHLWKVLLMPGNVCTMLPSGAMYRDRR